MDKGRVDEIRAALDAFEGVLNLPPTTYELEDGKSEFLGAIMPGLRELLDERERLLKVVDAAREAHIALQSVHGDRKSVSGNDTGWIAYHMLKDALAALDGEGGE
jgi:hypothetical protein